MKNDKLHRILLELNAEFDERALEWLISMYDAKSGGIYYSVSARDGDEFEPDIESTAQFLDIISMLGLIDKDDEGRYDIPEWFAEGAVEFLTSRQDESDGYFYDPIYKEIGSKDKKKEIPAKPPRHSKNI